jgi:hypothetical protein
MVPTTKKKHSPFKYSLGMKFISINIFTVQKPYPFIYYSVIGDH